MRSTFNGKSEREHDVKMFIGQIRKRCRKKIVANHKIQCRTLGFAFILEAIKSHQDLIVLLCLSPLPSYTSFNDTAIFPRHITHENMFQLLIATKRENIKYLESVSLTAKAIWESCEQQRRTLLLLRWRYHVIIATFSLLYWNPGGKVRSEKWNLLRKTRKACEHWK